MPRRLWLSLGSLALGASLLATAQLAGAARGSRQGGILRIGVSGASVQIDPQVAYISTAWWLEYATAAKLFNYPDRPGAAGNVLVPEVASGYKVSRDGRTYTFFIRKGFRFSDGTPVTAASFAYALDRAANHDLASPAAQFITDSSGTNIVGARDVNEGRATHVRGVVAGENRLIVRLTRPDGAFVIKLAMPFFQATSRRLPLSHEMVTGYPSAGPYAFTQNELNTLTELRRNPYYRGARPRNLRGVEVRWNLDERAGYEQALANQLDEGPLPSSDVQRVADRFGVNKTRFWVKPISCVGWLLFNSGEGLFRNNVRLRQAVSWAVDRTDYAALAGPYAGSPWTRLLPPGFPGLIRAKTQPYASRSRITRARKLAAGHFKNGKIAVAYFGTSGSLTEAQAKLVRRDLIRLGFKPENIAMKPYSGAGPVPFPPQHGWDLATSAGWCADYPDPLDFLVPLLGGADWLPTSITSPEYQRKIAAARRLLGNARLRALGELELDLDKNVVPIAPMRTYNNRYLFSNRVDPRSLSYQAVYSDWSIPALALK